MYWRKNRCVHINDSNCNCIMCVMLFSKQIVFSPHNILDAPPWRRRRGLCFARLFASIAVQTNEYQMHRTATPCYWPSASNAIKNHKTFYSVANATKFLLTTKLMRLVLGALFQQLWTAHILSLSFVCGWYYYSVSYRFTENICKMYVSMLITCNAYSLCE